MEIPNLGGFADPQNVSTKPGGFNASYINWARTLHDIRSNAQGWMPEMVEDCEGRQVHKAPDGSAYLMIQFRHADGSTTTSIPHAIMDNRMKSIKGDQISSRDISDSFVRGACKCAAAVFGYAWEMWSKDDPMERTVEEEEEIEEERKETAKKKKSTKSTTTEGKVRQSTGNKLSAMDKAKALEWPGKKKHHNKTLGWIADNDPNYLKTALKDSYDVIKDQSPTLLKAMELIVSKLSGNGKQDFPEAK